MRRITAEDESIRMPPFYSGQKLTKQEIERFIEWDRTGRSLATALGIPRTGLAEAAGGESQDMASRCR